MSTLLCSQISRPKQMIAQVVGQTVGYHDLHSYDTTFIGDTVPALTSATYDIDVKVDDNVLTQVAIALLDTDSWTGIAVKIQAAVRSATSGLEVVTIDTTDGTIRFASATLGLSSKMVVSAGTTGSGGGDLIAAITAQVADMTAFLAPSDVVGTEGDIDTIAYQEISNEGDLETFGGLVATGLTDATYDLDITLDGGSVDQIAIALLATDTWEGTALKIESALQTATSSTETVRIVDGKIRVTSATTDGTASVAIVAGTTGSGGGDLLAAITALSDDYTATVDTAIAGAEGSVTFDVGIPRNLKDSIGCMFEVRNSSGTEKSSVNFDVDIDTTTGYITINDVVSSGDLVAGDIVILQVWFYTTVTTD